MSVSAMTWAWGQRIPSNEKIVLVAIADRANDDGECWPGYASLADKCSMSERNVIRVVKSLESQNLLSVEHRKHSDSHQQKTNIYRLNLAYKPHDNLSPSPHDNLSPSPHDNLSPSPHDNLSPGNEQKPGDKCDKSRVTPVSPNTSVNQTKEKTTPRTREQQAEESAPRPEGVLACRLINLNVSVTSMHPILISWVQDKIPTELIEQCVGLARQLKPWPEKIAPGYLDRIIRSELKPKRDMSWLMSDEATIAKGQEVGIEARVGESMPDYRNRLRSHFEAANDTQRRQA